MSQPVNKFEEVLGDIKSTHRPTEPTVTTDSSPITFPQILDYTFPKSIPGSKVKQIGRVTYSGDGICKVTGLDNIKNEDIINIETDTGHQMAFILGMTPDTAEAVILGDYTKIRRGAKVYASGTKLTIPVGEGLEGRVINPLGEPLDGKGPIKKTTTRDVEYPAPGVVDRTPVVDRLHSGIISIDTTIPIGRGQRELVIGDRKTGKTRTMIDYISNQKGKGIHCVYVGIGTQAAKAKATLELLTKRGALSYTTIVMTFSDDPPTLQYIAPYAGAAIGEYYMYNGKHALVIYDDLSKQAKAYRQVSLLLKRSPGRDAYPGDIFFLHSRLLERAAKLNSQLGGGSLTALPVAETQLGDVSDYIITNLMSITDGHIYLDANMMHEGLLPAINSGESVSRIGGKVQSDLLQKVSELASRALARYEEVKTFETINAEVSQDTLLDIERGKRVREMFSQNSAENFSEDEQIVLLALTTSKRFDNYDFDTFLLFRKLFLSFYRDLDVVKINSKITAAKKLEDIKNVLDHVFESFINRYAVSKKI